ncbi:efflux RND transporter periplasmic adaptor subunit [Rubellicoccus peritrichatus]|uniref:Efflux RND transporter periplasmic adaptor subunit n=1 Tax=Rubellicoccus peritrichatus TaxID=3080537 RepID=A0AAQ3L680_9BACT|nr:efflux RND transporter periplasmic adaptor subunit [Puniceicoccus sp. CR14]WOO40244.1 efflux RND transporter periplasmic adaptor subunit [Puniceicoccus sp. CR14]
MNRPLGISAIASTILLLNACSKEEQQAAPQALPVVVATPIEERIIEYSEFTGRLEAVEMVEVRPRVNGYIQSIHFEEGEKVNQGDLLYVIDPAPFEAQVNRRQAQLEQEQAALSLAKANLDRAERLVDADAISKEEADIRRSEALQAAADVKAAEAELQIAKLDLGYTRVTAPINGIADRHQVTIGNLVSGEQANATLLTTIVPHDPIYAYYEVDERSFLRGVRQFLEGETPGRGSDVSIPAYLGLDDETGFPHEGEIDFASNQIDPDTATMTVRAIFENDDEFLTPGLFARIRVPASKEKDQLLIPEAAIGTDQTHLFVWVVRDDNTVEQRRIEIGPKHHNLRVVRNGLEPDDRIATAGIQFLQPGMLVDPQPGAIELAASN